MLRRGWHADFGVLGLERLLAGDCSASFLSVPETPFYDVHIMI